LQFDAEGQIIFPGSKIPTNDRIALTALHYLRQDNKNPNVKIFYGPSEKQSQATTLNFSKYEIKAYLMKQKKLQLKVILLFFTEIHTVRNINFKSPAIQS